jgi:hypothetical protein
MICKIFYRENRMMCFIDFLSFMEFSSYAAQRRFVLPEAEGAPGKESERKASENRYKFIGLEREGNSFFSNRFGGYSEWQNQ